MLTLLDIYNKHTNQKATLLGGFLVFINLFRYLSTNINAIIKYIVIG